MMEKHVQVGEGEHQSDLQLLGGSQVLVQVPFVVCEVEQRQFRFPTFDQLPTLS